MVQLLRQGLNHLFGRLEFRRLVVFRQYLRVDVSAARRFVANEVAKAQSQAALSGSALSLPAAASIISTLNASGAKAPGGGNAYAGSASDASGAVGIALSSGTYTISLPAYKGLTSESATVN